MDEGADESKTTFPLVEVTTAILVKVITYHLLKWHFLKTHLIVHLQVIEYMKHYIETPQNEIERPLKSNSLQGVVQPWYTFFQNLYSFSMILIIPLLLLGMSSL